MPGAPPFQMVVICEKVVVLFRRIRAKTAKLVVEQMNFFMTFTF